MALRYRAAASTATRPARGWATLRSCPSRPATWPCSPRPKRSRSRPGPTRMPRSIGRSSGSSLTAPMRSSAASAGPGGDGIARRSRPPRWSSTRPVDGCPPGRSLPRILGRSSERTRACATSTRVSPASARCSSPTYSTPPCGWNPPDTRRPERPMYFDEFKHQLPDIDPQETDEWLASLDQVVEDEGENRARFLMFKLLKRARQLHVGLPPLTQTRYINTISPEQEPFFSGDEELEHRIRRIVRWNAVAMVLRANNRFTGIGGHLATYASAASLYEVGFNHFFKGKDEKPGDQVYYQGHAAPGMYARAYLEGRLSEDQLDHFRRETVPGQGLSSYPHPRLMPDFWEFPTVSMGLGPISAIYQARYNRYLHNRGLLDTSNSRVWAFLGDGETDEPESLGALHVAAREGLDNLTFVVNCNLQRLDGPVRGNGKIIQELESVFRGSGWNVIKVIWGREWDELLARDVDGLLVEKMNNMLDGEFQKYSVASK